MSTGPRQRLRDAIAAEGPGYFAREYFELHPGKRRYLDWVLATVERARPPAGPLLDLGSGFGFLTAACSAAGRRAFGLELSPYAAGRSGSGSAVADVGRPLPIADGRLAAVTLLDVIEHLKDPALCCDEAHRALAPGGVLVVVTLNRASLARPLLGRRWAWYRDPTHLHMFSAGDLDRLLRRAGFVDIEVGSILNFCAVGESNPHLRPLRRIGRVVRVPWFGDALVAVGRRR